MNFKTLLRLRPNVMVYDLYDEQVLTSTEAIEAICERWKDYNGDLVPCGEWKETIDGNMTNGLREDGSFDINVKMTKEFADSLANDVVILTFPLVGVHSGLEKIRKFHRKRWYSSA